MAEHSRRAGVFADRLAEAGLDVVYPGLPEHPDHGIMTRLHREEYGFGGILCVDLESRERADRFMEGLQNDDRFGFIAVSLGYFETLMSSSATTTSSELSEDERRAAGIRPGLVRMSIGYTGTLEQRWRPLENALGLLTHA
jgi:methionine-gamma-lyase